MLNLLERIEETHYEGSQTCPVCGGSGKDDEGDECDTCGGTGEI